MKIRHGFPLPIIVSCTSLILISCLATADPETPSIATSSPLLPDPLTPYPSLPKAETPVPHPYPTRRNRPAMDLVTPEPGGVITLSPEEIATLVQGFREMADITLETTGETFTYTLGTRFFVFLDDNQYPVDMLKCEPSGIIGYRPNGSFRGPYLYPIYYEAVKIGECSLQNNDFKVNIVVVERRPSSLNGAPIPTNPPYP